MKVRIDDTIAAIATPSGEGAIAVVRMSGSLAIGIADRVFRGKTTLGEAQGHTVHHGNIIDPGNGKIIDEVLATVFKGPRSYTGEDSVEFSCHAGFATTNGILQILLNSGTRLADPGEFTRRAFLGGKMDLSQAEAVADIIAARSTRAQDVSLGQLRGQLGKSIREIRAQLVNTCSLLEIDLDFSEEGITVVNRTGIEASLRSCCDRVEELLETFTMGKMVRDGVNVAIVGPPNAGKSSLFNRLLGDDRAIVSEVPGTTRDYLEESISISGLLVSITDTAGIRQSTDFVEVEGVSRALEAASRADITLLVLDCTGTPDRASVTEILSQFQHTNKVLLALNKVDLVGSIHREPGKFSCNGTQVSEVFVSALSGDGVDRLRGEILNLAIGGPLNTDTGVRVTSQRHAEALRRAKNHLDVSLMSLKSEVSNEFVAMDVRSAAEAVGEITGEVTTEEILNSVFSKFCVGK